MRDVATPLDPHRAREARTGAQLLASYCRRHHGGTVLCSTCQDLAQYASERLQRCVFGAAKPTCARCPIHCYAPQRRQQMVAVMRSEGPRMLWRHPWLAFRHWRDGRRPVPAIASHRPQDP